MLCKGKKKLTAAMCSDGSTRSNLTFAFQNCRVKFVQHFSGSYALIQVFCFCSTNFTWFNSIIKYKNLSTNKYVWFYNKIFSLYLTKKFIIKKMANFIQPSISPTQYIYIHTETRQSNYYACSL